MSQNKYYREAWIKVVYEEAVALFHRARQDNAEEIPLADLARQCANTAFQDRAHQIVGDKETLARGFMAHCRDNFGTEIALALAAQTQADMEKTRLREVPAS